MKNIFEVSRKVHEAITSKKPIVALESTLISHGLPYPENIQVANESIMAVEDNGAVAATIGIIKGKVKIGLSHEDIELLAKDKNVQKVSNHNINLSIFNKENAATTVASTISIASKFQIKFFATGGIGGVHLNVENTNDAQEVIEDDSTQTNESQENNFTEEKLLDELSNVDDITSLPEEEQLKPEIIEEEVYDDPTVYNDDQDLNDLLNRVDDLLNSYSN